MIIMRFVSGNILVMWMRHCTKILTLVIFNDLVKMNHLRKINLKLGFLKRLTDSLNQSNAHKSLLSVTSVTKKEPSLCYSVVKIETLRQYAI